jgi:signal transduction histidine kinase
MSPSTLNSKRIIALTPHLRRWMGALSILIFIVFAWLIPNLYQRAVTQDRTLKANLVARSLAERYSQIVARDPDLWAYRTHLLSEEARSVSKRGATLKVSTALREDVFTAGPMPSPLAIRGEAFIYAGPNAVGRLTLWLNPHPLQGPHHQVWVLAILLGAVVSLAVYLIPLWTAKRSDQLNTSLWTELNSLTSELEDRVTHRTHELNALSQRLMRIQEEERTRISRNLHDELGQSLTGLRLQLTTLNVIAPHPSIEEMNETVDLAVEQIRTIAHALRPPELDALGLSVALTRLIESRLGSTEIEVSLENSLSTDPSNALSEVIYRVIQESITNLLRHAQAQRFWIKLTLDERRERVALRIEDDGQGADLSDPHHWGLGLMGIRSRVDDIGGQLVISRGAYGGLSLSIELPTASL